MDLVAGRVWADERRPIRHLDPVLLVTTMLLAVAGLFLVYSATNQSLRTLHLDPGTFVKKQFTALVLGFVMLIVVAAFDYRFYKVYAGFIYAATIVALVLVRTPLGASPAGAQRWFTFGGFQLTPSEFAKIALAIMVGAVLSEIRTAEPTLTDVLRVTLIGLVPMGLVFIQPDIGTTIVLVAIVVGILVVAGTRAKHLAILALASIVLLFGAFQMGIIKDYQLQRLWAFNDSNKDLQGANYNRNQAEIAIGSGGLVGQGYLNGRLTNLDFVPEQHTDFIFTVAGEEFGFAGAALILALFAILMWRAIRISFLSKDAFGTYLAAGIAAMFAIQMFVNVGMVIGIMPITGIPLPFLSYGGSSMLANFIAVGLLLNIHMRRFT
jgi:rod shape determining protein RodA